MATGNLRGVLSGSVRYIQGPAGEGGYYFPTVEDGILTWVPSSPNLPAAEPANVRGPAGAPGADGQNGADGAKGDPGEPGYSPVKGVDYWTEEDKAEIESSVIEELSKTKTSASITLSAEGWDDKRQTVNLNSVTADSIVIVSPAPAEENFKAYADCEVRCESQGNGTLTFVCEDVPRVSLVVNVAVFN